jgi:hypothetical protein
MIRVKRRGRLSIRDLTVVGWFIEGEDEFLVGDFNDLSTPAGQILMAAIWVDLAGYRDFELVTGEPEVERFGVARAAADAIEKARAPVKRRHWWRFWR